MALPNTNSTANSAALGAHRVRLWYGALLLIITIFGVRLFYVQIIRYSHYKSAALSDQLKQYEIPANRGIISARDSGQLIPVVLNQKLYTLYADPVYIKNPDTVANKVSAITGGSASKLADMLRTKHTRYVVLGKKLSGDQNKRLLALKYPGLGTQGQDFRTYPQGDLAAQLLGFVDDGGQGRYGLEQALDQQLKGIPGQLRAITDIRGVPLAASRDNTEVAAKKGDDIVLTLDLAIQQQVQTILQKSVQSTKASGGSVVVMDPRTGAVKAMANYPSYDPAKYNEVENAKLFANAAVSEPIEVGSIMKTLTTAAALDKGVIAPSTTYYDPSSWLVNGFRITNIEEDGGAGTRSVADILNFSLNTGATWELMQLGGGSINEKARTIWHDYLINHYLFGKPTGIEQGYEAGGYVPDPAENGAGINLTYANTTFGQAMTATPIQMAAAIAAAVNGGTYFQPHLVDQTIASDGTVTKKAPKVLASNVVSAKVSQALIPLMQNVINKHNIIPAFDQSQYIVGGKTGTAQIAKPGGGYYSDKFNGTYLGFVGGDSAQYVIAVFMDKPTNGGYAGTAAAQPVFASIAHMLIDESLVTPKTK
ncbi:MAG: penicillin-binding protein 2 [Patescibacteria group bacterium]|nr:penicillin-binding protein 2 [Patescibacteria group bacterium]